MTANLNIEPDIKLSVKQTFGIDSEMQVDAFSKKSEFVPDIDSWISLSLLKTQEDIKGDGHGYIPRPTDRRLNTSIFFQDYFPNNPNYKMQLSLIYGTGLPFGAPQSERHEQTLRIPSYKRLDIGFSRSIKHEKYKSKIKFLVFGRLINEKFMELQDLDIPKTLLDCCDSVPQNLFRNDVSSTKIRKSNPPSSSQ